MEHIPRIENITATTATGISSTVPQTTLDNCYTITISEINILNWCFLFCSDYCYSVCVKHVISMAQNPTQLKSQVVVIADH